MEDKRDLENLVFFPAKTSDEDVIFLKRIHLEKLRVVFRLALQSLNMMLEKDEDDGEM